MVLHYTTPLRCAAFSEYTTSHEIFKTSKNTSKYEINLIKLHLKLIHVFHLYGTSPLHRGKTQLNFSSETQLTKPRRRCRGQSRVKMNFNFTYESRDTRKSFTLFITVKTISKLNAKHSDEYEIKILVVVVHVLQTTQNLVISRC